MKLPTHKAQRMEEVLQKREAAALAERNQQSLDAIFDALDQLQKSGVNIGSKAKTELLERQRIRTMVRQKPGIR